jgi:hypothetical protein
MVKGLPRDLAREDAFAGKVIFNRDNKFDLQLSDALINERRLAEIFAFKRIETMPVRLELKTETWQWRRTGNIAIEYRQNGQPSGIAATEADYWVHELRDDDGKTLVYLMFPAERLKEIAREAYRKGHKHEGGGDGGRFCNVLVRLRELLKL